MSHCCKACTSHNQSHLMLCTNGYTTLPCGPCVLFAFEVGKHVFFHWHNILNQPTARAYNNSGNVRPNHRHREHPRALPLLLYVRSLEYLYEFTNQTTNRPITSFNFFITSIRLSCNFPRCCVYVIQRKSQLTIFFLNIRSHTKLKQVLAG